MSIITANWFHGEMVIKLEDNEQMVHMYIYESISVGFCFHANNTLNENSTISYTLLVTTLHYHM